MSQRAEGLVIIVFAVRHDLVLGLVAARCPHAAAGKRVIAELYPPWAPIEGGIDIGNPPVEISLQPWFGCFQQHQSGDIARAAIIIHPVVGLTVVVGDPGDAMLAVFDKAAEVVLSALFRAVGIFG